MTYPPQPDPYNQQPGYGQQPGYNQQPGYSPQQPVTGVPSSPAGGYAQPAYPPPGMAGPAGPPSEPGERPGLVTTAAMLMVGMTVLMLILGGLIIFFGIEESNTAMAACDSQYASSSCEDDATAGKVAAIISGVVFLFVGLGVIGLALAILRGHNWARITTWVVYGLFALCNVCGLLLSLGVMSSMSSVSTSSDTTGGVIVMLGFMVQLVIEGITIFMLAAPAANQWFRQIGQAKRAGVI